MKPVMPTDPQPPRPPKTFEKDAETAQPLEN